MSRYGLGRASQHRPLTFFKARLPPATTRRPFVVGCTHSSSERPFNPGRGVGAGRVYPVDVGRNGTAARAIIKNTYIKAVSYLRNSLQLYIEAPYDNDTQTGTISATIA